MMTLERAWHWHTQTIPLRGCNYLPRTAVNVTEMWQEETYDPATIDQELGWAQAAGYNSLRVFVQYLVWRDDPAGLLARLDHFLDIATNHGMRTMWVPFCDCSFSGREPYLGPQDAPIEGVHNSGWVPSPGLGRVTDRDAWPDLKRYIQDLVGRYGQDKRVLVWDLYNEPGNSNMGERSLPLVEATFQWAREADPAQPLTVGLWTDLKGQMSRRLAELSDVVSFHAYGDPQEVESTIEACQSYDRPLLCTEWLRRQAGNTFATILPLFRQHKIGWYHWGLVAGKTQTYMPWGSKPGDPMPAVWQHDVLHPNGRPYDESDIELVRGFTRS
jgi:hypothetical protein